MDSFYGGRSKELTCWTEEFSLSGCNVCGVYVNRTRNRLLEGDACLWLGEIGEESNFRMKYLYSFEGLYVEYFRYLIQISNGLSRRSVICCTGRLTW